MSLRAKGGNVSKIIWRLFHFGVASLVLSGLLLGPRAFSQSDDGYDDRAATYISLENGYLGVGIGMYGKWGISPPNHFLQPSQPVGGRFHLWCTGGDPTTIQDDGQYLNFSLLSPPPGPGDKWGSFQLMVDTYSTEAESVERVWATFERGVTSAMIGDIMDGDWAVWPYTPSNLPNVITGSWYPIPNGGVSYLTSDSIGNVMPVNVRCDMEVRLLRDTVRFKWKLTNEDSFDHYVGLRVFADLMTNPEDDGTTDLRNVISAPGYPLIIDRTVMADDDATSKRKVPSLIEYFNSQADPSTSIRMTLKEQGATPPDRLGVDEWLPLAGDVWSYWYDWSGRSSDPYVFWMYPTPPVHQYIYDLGYGSFWKPRRLPAGQSMTFIHYIGLASATSDFTKPNIDYPQYVAAVQGPRVLNYYSTLGVGALDPNPFTITAYLYNTAKYVDLLNPSFTLTLPSGLTLDDSEAGKYTKSISKILADSEQSVSWKVKPDGHPTGIMEYAVSFSAAPVGGTTVRRKVNIAATEKQPLAAGWQMISVPFSVTNHDPKSLLGLPSGIFWEYDPHQGAYQAVSSVVPGKAYWLKLSSAQPTSMTPPTYEPVAWAGTQGYPVDLSLGWNLVGNPFLYTVTLGECTFYQRDYGTMEYDEAISRGLISSTVFWWDPIFRQYRWSSDRSVQIKPWQGYWIRALQSGVTMTITPSSQIGAVLGGVPTGGGGDGGGGGPPSGP